MERTKEWGYLVGFWLDFEVLSNLRRYLHKKLCGNDDDDDDDGGDDDADDDDDDDDDMCILYIYIYIYI